MAAVTVSEARRRSDEDRSHRTRERILQAAVELLTERGYAATSIAAVQARAGVSRGALLHQYAGKAHLLVDAVRHLAERQGEQLAAEAPGAPARSPATDWLTPLWDSFSSPLFGAVLELWIAARTDDELRRVLLEYERRLRLDLHRIAAARIPGGPPPAFDMVFDMTLTYYRGLALTAIVSDRHQEKLLSDWRTTVSALLR